MFKAYLPEKRHHFLKSQTKEPPKLLTSSGIKRGKFTSVNNLSAQKLASSKNRHILNFRVMAVRDYERICRKMYTYLRILQPSQILKYMEKYLFQCLLDQFR